MRAGARGGARQTFAKFWLGCGAIALLWALGGFTPFFKLVYALVPGTKYFRAPSSTLYVLAFSLAVLSAIGFERLLQRNIPLARLKRYVLGWVGFASLIALLAWSGALTYFATILGQQFAVQFGHDPDGFREFIERNRAALMLGATRSLAVVLGASALAYGFSLRKVKPTTFALAMVMLCSVDLWSVARHYWMFGKPARELYGNDPIINYLKAQQEPGRVFVHTRTADYRTPSDPYFGANGFGEGAGFMVHGIRTVTGYQGNVLARYEAISSGDALINPNFWRHENVRWLYTNIDIADTALKKINGPLINSAGSTAYLYEMPGANPYAWVAASYGGQDDSTALRAILDGAHNPREFVAFDTATILDGRKVGGPPALMPRPSEIVSTVSAFGPGRATIQLSAPAVSGSALVISENYYAGWQATADGMPVPVVRAAFNLVGVPLPEGARVVTFQFRDARYATGRFLTLLSLCFCFALILPQGLRKFRTRRAPIPG